MGLHHGGAVEWGGVGRVDLHRGGGERASEIAHRTVGWLAIAWSRNARLIEVGAKCIFSARPIVVYVHQVGSSAGLLKTLGHHEGNWFTVAHHFWAGQHRVGLAVVARALMGRVTIGENEDDARRLLRSARIDRFYRSFSDRSFDHKAVQRVLTLLHLVGVARAAGNFQSPVNTIERFADDAIGTDIKGIRANG